MAQNLAQHFLTSDQVVADIVDAANIHSSDVVLEIGPGKGVLTSPLLEKARKVIAVEKDPQLAADMEEIYHEQIVNKRLEIVEADIRDIDLDSTLQASSYKLVANIPYYITGEIIRLFLTTKHQPQSITLLMQKEVAERIVTDDGQESVLSLSVKAYGSPEIVRLVSKKHFSPAPKVDSAVLHISNVSRDFFIKNTLDETDFFQLVKTGFKHKRKTLVNNLSSVPNTSKKEAESALVKCGLEKKVRAEKLNLKQWACLQKFG